MYKPTNEELEIIRRTAINTPRFIDIMTRMRESARDDMEQGGGDLARGRSLAYSHILKLLTLRGEPTR